MKRLLYTFILATLGVAAARADTLSITIDQSVLYGVPNGQVSFTGTITNISNAPVYINGGGTSFLSPPLGTYSVGPSYPFGGTALLAPGASSGDQVLLSVGLPPDPYITETFTSSLSGGATPTSSTNLGSFTLTLNAGAAPAPEIDPSLASSGLVLLAGAIAILRGHRIRQAACQS